MSKYKAWVDPNKSPMEPNHHVRYNQNYQMLVERVELTNEGYIYGECPTVILKGQLIPSTLHEVSILDKAFLTPFEQISRIEVSGPCTIVFFNDGSKEIVRKTESDSDNLEIAILYAVAKHCYESNSKMHKHLHKLIDNALDRQKAREEARRVRAKKKAEKKKKNKKNRRS